MDREMKLLVQPIPRPIFKAILFKVIAFLVSMRLTRPSKKGEIADVLIVSLSPSRKTNTEKLIGVTNPDNVIIPRIRAIANIQL